MSTRKNGEHKGAHRFLQNIIFKKGNEFLKKIISMMLAFVMVFSMVPFNVVFAEETEIIEENEEETVQEVQFEPVEHEAELLSTDENLPEGIIAQGSCGATEEDDISWSISEDGVLTISGTGMMADYKIDWTQGAKTSAPWRAYSATFEGLVLGEGVTHIGDYAFYLCKFEGPLTIPSTVKSIGISTFAGSSLAGDLVIPEGLESVGVGAFEGNCFTSITIPASLKTIKEGEENISVFAPTNYTEEFIVAKENPIFTEIDGVLFSKDGTKLLAYPNRKRLSTYTVPQTVTTIATQAFSCANIDEVIVSENVEVLESYAFNWTFADRIVINSKLSEIDEHVFNTDGYDVYFMAGAPENVVVKEDYHYSFDENTNIYYVDDGSWELDENGLWNGYAVTEYVPNNHVVEFNPEDYVASGYFGEEVGGKNLAWMIDENGVLTIKGKGPIKDYKFIYVEGDTWGKSDAPWCEYADIVTSLKIEEGITEIGNYAFRGMVNIEGTLDIPEGVTRIGRIAFRGCCKLSGELELPSTLKTVDDSAFENSGKFTGTLVIPEGTEKIGDCAFRDMNITAITIPASVTSIGYAPFIFNEYLESITVDKDNQYYCSVDGVLFNKDMTEIIQVPMALTGSYTVPDSVTKIGSGAFTANNLDEIIVPETVKTVVGGNYNYSKAPNMIFKGAPEEIGYNCLSHGSIYFMGGAPKNVVAATESRPSFGQYLTLYYIDDGSWEFDENGLWNGYTLIPFEGNGAVEFDPDDYDDSGYCGADIGGLNAAWLLKDGALTIRGKGAMKDYAESGSAEENIRTTDTPWFEYADEIDEIIIEDGITRIGDCAFELVGNAKNSVKRIEVPESVKEIGKNAFWGCCSGGKIIIKSDLDSFDATAFIFSASDIYFLGDAPENITGSYADGITFHYLKEANGWDIADGKWNGYTVFAMSFDEWWDCVDKVPAERISVGIDEILSANDGVTYSYDEETGKLKLYVSKFSEETWKTIYDENLFAINGLVKIPEDSTYISGNGNDDEWFMYYRQRSSSSTYKASTYAGIYMGFAEPEVTDNGTVYIVPYTMGNMFKPFAFKDAEGNITYEYMQYEVVLGSTDTVVIEGIGNAERLFAADRIVPDKDNELVEGKVFADGKVEYIYKGTAKTVDEQKEALYGTTTVTRVYYPEGYSFDDIMIGGGPAGITEGEGYLDVMTEYQGNYFQVNVQLKNAEGNIIKEKMQIEYATNRSYNDEAGFTAVPRSRMKVSEETIAFFKFKGVNYDIDAVTGDVKVTFDEEVDINGLLESGLLYTFTTGADYRFEITPPEGAVYYKWNNSSAGSGVYYYDGYIADESYLTKQAIKYNIPSFAGGKLFEKTEVGEETLWRSEGTYYLKTYWWYDAEGNLLSKEYIRAYIAPKTFAVNEEEWLLDEGFVPMDKDDITVFGDRFMRGYGIDATIPEDGKVNVAFYENVEIKELLRVQGFSVPDSAKKARYAIRFEKPEEAAKVEVQQIRGAESLGTAEYEFTGKTGSTSYGNVIRFYASGTVEYTPAFMTADLFDDVVRWNGGVESLLTVKWFDESGNVIGKEYITANSEGKTVYTERKPMAKIEAGDYYGSGYCGAVYDGITNIGWALDKNGVLTISGTGDMANFIQNHSGIIYKPWEYLESYEIKSVKFVGDITHIGDGAFYGTEELSGNVVLPESLESIGQVVFYDTKISGAVMLPKNLERFCTNSFAGCGINDITVAEENENFCAENGIVYSKDMTEIKLAAPAIEGDIYIPESVTSIDINALKHCDNELNIYFRGDAPEEELSFDSEKVTIYYDVKNDGWELDSNGKWHGYNTDTWVVPVPVTGIEIVVPEKIYTGYPEQIEAILAPEDTTTENVEWNVVNTEGEATITEDGVLTATKGGKVIIEAKAKDDDGFVATKEVYITELGDEEALIKVSSAVAAEKGGAKVYIELSEGTNANTVQFAVSYDAEKLKLLDTAAGELMADIAPSVNTNTPGIIIFGWDGETAITEGGNLLELSFEVLEGTKGSDIEVTVLPDSDEYSLLVAKALEDMIDYDYLNVNIENGKISVIDGMLGDVNLDGRINVVDANIVRRSVAKYVTLDEIQTILADVNSDGEINVMDANYIRKFAVKLFDEFEVAKAE